VLATAGAAFAVFASSAGATPIPVNQCVAVPGLAPDQVCVAAVVDSNVQPGMPQLVAATCQADTALIAQEPTTQAAAGCDKAIVGVSLSPLAVVVCINGTVANTVNTLGGADALAHAITFCRQTEGGCVPLPQLAGGPTTNAAVADRPGCVQLPGNPTTGGGGLPTIPTPVDVSQVRGDTRQLRTDATGDLTHAAGDVVDLAGDARGDARQLRGDGTGDVTQVGGDLSGDASKAKDAVRGDVAQAQRVVLKGTGDLASRARGDASKGKADAAKAVALLRSKADALRSKVGDQTVSVTGGLIVTTNGGREADAKTTN
jgi:hypothetical protein